MRYGSQVPVWIKGQAGLDRGGLVQLLARVDGKDLVGIEHIGFDQLAPGERNL
jgi:hypothetical protein